MASIYADHAATTPLDPSVAEVMYEEMISNPGNPSSIHSFGRSARKTVDEARRQAASSIGAVPENIIFTSGGTEADNLAVAGFAKANEARGRHIITTKIEHHAVLHPAEALEALGFDVDYIDVDESGIVSVKDIEAALREDTILVTVMHGNNETGALQPIAEIGALLQEHQAAFHTDAVQTFGLLDLNVDELKVDMLTASAHKIYGPKGAGFLYVRNHIQLEPALRGGEQERRRRAGTENVAQLAGVSKALKLADTHKNERYEMLADRSAQFVQALMEKDITFQLNGPQHERLPHIVNVSFQGVSVEPLLVNLDLAGIAVSSGSACTAGSVEPSHVLKAMYGDDKRIYSSVRFSFGRDTTAEEIDQIAESLERVLQRMAKKA
ncbi:cysteine desulfurase [Salsuginibacillus halophilus]|uniref:cysteine desulfurase n=1 Tax=Salsuginibacillus halophilus TaxID=517424 RepID=A0A2P8HFW1_9BACI|nr:cysteine desulfurase family protein [Salsuginibacillus halophilus]PSL45096.1 cysteine desulfurase [Salsuginibacillus halophilus]